MQASPASFSACRRTRRGSSPPRPRHPRQRLASAVAAVLAVSGEVQHEARPVAGDPPRTTDPFSDAVFQTPRVAGPVLPGLVPPPPGALAGHNPAIATALGISDA